MVKQYKKVAILDINQDSEVSTFENETMNIPINLSINPNKYIVFLKDKSKSLYLSNLNNNSSTFSGEDTISLSSINKKNMVINIKYSNGWYKGKVRIEKLIAIE